MPPRLFWKPMTKIAALTACVNRLGWIRLQNGDKRGLSSEKGTKGKHGRAKIDITWEFHVHSSPSILCLQKPTWRQFGLELLHRGKLELLPWFPLPSSWNWQENREAPQQLWGEAGDLSPKFLGQRFSNISVSGALYTIKQSLREPCRCVHEILGSSRGHNAEQMEAIYGVLMESL